MRSLRFRLQLFTLLFLLVLSVITAEAQSTNVEFPTPITSNSISGRIKARDIGDPRSTVHYYVFEGSQGDIFLKIETANLDGDIDIFYADNLRPLTKISLYADSSATQTGREIYLRKPEKLILKVEGKTPNDDPAVYSIKFEGSFLAMKSTKRVEEPKIPEVKSETESEDEVKVNSVGTIIETKPKKTIPKETVPKETVAQATRRRRTTTPQPVSTVKPKSTSIKKETKEPVETEADKEPEKKVELVVSDDLPKSTEPEKTEPISETEPKPKTTKKKTTPTRRKTTAKKVVEPKTTKPDPAVELAKALENVRLIVDFKDGGKIERPMNDILKFGVDKGVLTIINKDGSIGKYSILDVSKITIE